MLLNHNAHNGEGQRDSGAGAFTHGDFAGFTDRPGFGRGVGVGDQQRAGLSEASPLLPSPSDKATTKQIGGKGKDEIKPKRSRKEPNHKRNPVCSKNLKFIH